MSAPIEDYHWGIRFGATQSLVRLGKVSPEVTLSLSAALKNKNWDVRFGATQSLAQLGQTNPEVTQKILSNLIDALMDSSWDVRYYAVQSLVHLGRANPNVVPEILSNLLDTFKYGHIDVRSCVAIGLAQLGQTSPEVITSLVAAFKSHDTYYDVRCDAARLVGELMTPDVDVLDTLRDGLLDDENGIRTSCSTAFARLGERFPDAVEGIVTLLVTAIDDLIFENVSMWDNRTAQDYAYDGLWQLVVA
ncbi:MAG: HEAT repeat domain-containing protein [Chloroflexota bacterium]